MKANSAELAHAVAVLQRRNGQRLGVCGANQRVVLRPGHVSLEAPPATTSPPSSDHHTNQIPPAGS